MEFRKDSEYWSSSTIKQRNPKPSKIIHQFIQIYEKNEAGRFSMEQNVANQRITKNAQSLQY